LVNKQPMCSNNGSGRNGQVLLIAGGLISLDCRHCIKSKPIK